MSHSTLQPSPSASSPAFAPTKRSWVNLTFVLMICTSLMTWMICSSSSLNNTSSTVTVASTLLSSAPQIKKKISTNSDDDNFDNFPKKQSSSSVSSSPVVSSSASSPSSASSASSKKFISFVDREDAASSVDKFAGICYDRASQSDWSPTNCPDDTMWLRLWIEERRRIIQKQQQQQQQQNQQQNEIPPHHRHLNRWLMIDVGANKGFTLGRWLESLVGASRISKYNTFNITLEAMKRAGDPDQRSKLTSVCGACCDCTEEAVDFASQEEFDHLSPVGKELLEFEQQQQQQQQQGEKSNFLPPIRLIGVEPVLANFHFLTTFFSVSSNEPSWMQKYRLASTNQEQQQQQLQSSTSTKPVFDIRLAAASIAARHGQKAMFRAGPFGVETNSFKNKKAKKGIPVVPVDIIALDNLIQSDPAYSDSFIDFFTSDTEGFDIDAQSGAHQLLKANRIKLYVFEMHQKLNYENVFRTLASYNYECYYPSQPTARGETRVLPHLVRITGEQCFSVPRLKRLMGWMNAVCANKVTAPELVNILGWLTEQTRPSKVTCGTTAERDVALDKAEKWLKNGKRE